MEMLSIILNVIMVLVVLLLAPHEIVLWVYAIVMVYNSIYIISVSNKNKD